MLYTNVSASNESFSDLAACDFIDISYPVKIGQVVGYSIVLFFSVVGNFLIILTVSKRRELKKTTNFFIVNMACSDVLFTLVAMPVHLAAVAKGSFYAPIGGTAGLIFCKAQRFVESVSFTVSIQSLVWIAVDRLVAVVFPLKAHLISSISRRIAIASTWLVSGAVNSYDLYVYEVFEEYGKVFCLENFDKTAFAYFIYARVYTALFQIAPLIAMTVIYSVIAHKLRRQGKVLHQTSRVHQKDLRKRRAVKLAFSIMAATNTCYLPPLIATVFWQYHVTTSCVMDKVLWLVGIFMLYLSSLVNPIVCFVLVQSYRSGLKKVLCSAGSTEASEQGGTITLRSLRSNPTKEFEDNPAFSGDQQ